MKYEREYGLGVLLAWDLKLCWVPSGWETTVSDEPFLRFWNTRILRLIEINLVELWSGLEQEQEIRHSLARKLAYDGVKQITFKVFLKCNSNANTFYGKFHS